MSKEIVDVAINGDKVTLKFVEHGYKGSIVARQQITVSRAGLEAALDAATVEIPWRGLI